MDKIINEIIISADGIDVISKPNGVEEIVELDLYGNEEILQDILERNNLSLIANYKCNEMIALALGDNNKQLRSYLEICKRISNGNKVTEWMENIPQIVYELRGLKNNKELTIDNKISLYQQAKQVRETLGKKVSINMGVVDRVYLTIQKLLHTQNKIKALNSGDGKVQEDVAGIHAENSLTTRENFLAGLQQNLSEKIVLGPIKEYEESVVREEQVMEGQVEQERVE